MRAIFFPIIVALAFASCTAHRQYRTDFSRSSLGAFQSEPSTERQSRTHEVYEGGFSLSHIEFDDQGEFWERDLDSSLEGGERHQLASFEDLIEQRLERGDFKNKGALIVTYAHGWNHSPAEEDQNLADFRRLLYELSKDSTRPVIGVYLGWRGRLIPDTTEMVGFSDPPTFLAPLNAPRFLTYWDRKRKAEKIGRRRLGETLTRLAELRKKIIWDKRGEGLPNSRHAKTRLIAIGHSFGAAAMFNGVSRFFEDELTRLDRLQEVPRGRRPNDERDYIDRRWDLVVLVNPAFEALQYSAIHRYTSAIDPDQMSKFYRLPRLLVVSAENDSANRSFFPIGQGLGTFFAKTQDEDERKKLVTALGHYEPFHTHRLEPDGTTGGKLAPKSVAPATLRYASSEQSRYASSLAEFERITTDFNSIGPCMVAQASKGVISHHGKIWTDEFRLFLQEFIKAREKAAAKL